MLQARRHRFLRTPQSSQSSNLDPGHRGPSGPAPAPPRRLLDDRDLNAREEKGESMPVATRRPGDVSPLSLVPQATGRTAAPGTICVCPWRGGGASGVWRGRGSAPSAAGGRAGGGRRTEALSGRGLGWAGSAPPWGAPPWLPAPCFFSHCPGGPWTAWLCPVYKRSLASTLEERGFCLRQSGPHGHLGWYPSIGGTQ